MSAGQAAANPVQFSAASQTPPAAARQTVEVPTKPFVGQVAAEPLHDSATSQMPADGRQTPPETK